MNEIRTKDEILALKEAKLLVPFDRKKNRKKHTLWALQGGICLYCDTPFEKEEDATFDHVKPKSKGGKSALTNLRLVCKPCNQMKGNMETYAEAVAEAGKVIAFFKRLQDKGIIQ